MGGAAAQPPVGRGPAALGGRLRVRRARGGVRECAESHLPGARRGAAPRRARAGVAGVGRPARVRAPGACAVRARVGGPHGACGAGGGARALRALLRVPGGAARRGHPATVAGGRDRADGVRGRRAGRLRTAAAPQQRAPRRPPCGGPAALAGRALRLGRDGLRGPVRGRRVRGPARPGVACRLRRPRLRFPARRWVGRRVRRRSRCRVRLPPRGAARALQLRAAGLVACLAVAFDLLFFTVSELPATVPVAVGLVLVAVAHRARTRGTEAPRALPSWSRPPARTRPK